LLLWIYFSGVILLFGGCIAATIHGPRIDGKFENPLNLRPGRRPNTDLTRLG
jgi:uncharacterized BrkB/YihY/UPF0761 family membrane protein